MSLDIDLVIYVDTGGSVPHRVELGGHNYTHNVVPMWKKAGIYEALYKSEGKQANEVIDELKVGKAHMEDFIDDYKELTPENGWGSVDGAIQFLDLVIDLFQQHPKGTIKVSV